MLYYKFKNYEEFQEIFGMTSHGNGVKSRKNKILLYMDGARLAYALACPENDVTLKDIASLCDVFYIGGTKCGALCG